ncbi:MAG: hypothetical protein HY556_08920 [Euryarchaeota archaeon]|nr:hypothetical protein [Euryarchaeota archaeon]
MSRKTATQPKPRLIDRQNRVALPSEIMSLLDAAVGDYVYFEVYQGNVTLRKVRWVPERGRENADRRA